ncbi:MAG TPA: hypothetical protein VJY35_04635 [Candidatus Eisenbacteria bacterium]|nr:hypothetical protein [Candidatus Eisenbacteria bacterium]
MPVCTIDAPGTRRRPGGSFPRAAACALAIACLLGPAGRARAKVEIFDRGPELTAGKFNLRVTNAGILGNPFPDLSFDPSFEYPRGSGQELMRYAALWVGALDERGLPHVSGAPLLEFRPTLAEDDTVREAWHGRIGSFRAVDDDGDGRVDEELLNDRDDDGDGEVDEDIGLIGQQMMASDYTDDQPEAVAYLGPNGEPHRPFGLTVHQETYAWAFPGYDGIVGTQYTITNHSGVTLREVYLGVYVDLDARTRDEPAGHSNDVIGRVSFNAAFPKGTSRVFVDGQGLVSTNCFNRASRTRLPYVDEPPGSPSGHLPVVAVLPLAHTRDPLSWYVPSAGRAPARDTFKVAVYAIDRPSGAGGPPLVDAERYAAMRGQWEESTDGYSGDQSVLVSCGPFHTLAPGQTLELAVALVAAAGPESLVVNLTRAAFLHNGSELNLVPDDHGEQANWWLTGATGINGHEGCVEPPAGLVFVADPNCSRKFGSAFSDPPRIIEATYRSGQCIWSDADCDVCTGLNGRETILRWLDPNAVPPAPSFRVVAGDHGARIEWDNLPEILVNAHQAGTRNGTFVGYRVWRVSNWRNRRSLLPPQENWEPLGTFGFDTEDGKILLSTVTDTTLDYQRIWFEQKHYPVGRYSMDDPEPLNGFDYLYVVTSIVEVQTVFAGFPRRERFESPLVAEFGGRTTPRVEARQDAAGVWVVPNPFRGEASWDRPQVYGDRLTRHLDFMGLPRARCTIRIWTLAGDHVATIDHDGTNGSGQAPWNLVTRNGQEAASGVYIYTVESALGNAMGRFVVIR